MITKRIHRKERQDAKVFVKLPLANPQIFAFLNVEAAKGFEKFASANFFEESNNRSLRLGVLGGEKMLNTYSKFSIPEQNQTKFTNHIIQVQR